MFFIKSNPLSNTGLEWLSVSVSIENWFLHFRQIAQYDIVEREDGVTTEESAGTISSMEAFNPKTKKLW